MSQPPSYPPQNPPPFYQPPPQNQPPSYPPQNQPLDYMRQAAALRSYTTPAILTLVLYFLLWIPGLIANIVYLNAANNDRRVSGIDPQGRGCLQALLIVFIAVPFLACFLLVGLPFLRGLIFGG